MEILTIDGDEKVLRKHSANVSFDDLNLFSDIERIRDYCTHNDKLFALSAIQLGIPKRIVYVRSTNVDKVADEHPLIMINPKVTLKLGKTEFWEACMSCLDNIALVERPYSIVVEYYDQNCNYKIQNFEGFAATIISHELDHLDGILQMDRAKETLNMNEQEKAEWRKKHPYKVISKTEYFTY